MTPLVRRLRPEHLATLAIAGIVPVILIWVVLVLTVRLSNLVDETALVERRLAVQASRAATLRSIPGGDVRRPVFLAEDGSGMAGARLQQRIGDITLAQSVVINRIEVLTPDPAAAINVVHLSASMSGSVVGLRGVLYAIETGIPFLFVRELEIDAPEGEGPSASLINIHIVVDGYAGSEPGR